jgi:ribosomal protein S18 acetylase RimI-like enzyme
MHGASDRAGAIALTAQGVLLDRLLMIATIRAATAADAPFLWEMLYQALHVPLGQSPFPREILQQPEINQYLADWGRPDDFAWIAESEAQPVGAAWTRLLKQGYGFVDELTPELTVAVLPEYRGCGIGSKLLATLIAHARNHYPALSLSVSADNPAARLYQRLGFETLGRAGTSLVMRKSC